MGAGLIEIAQIGVFVMAAYTSLRDDVALAQAATRRRHILAGASLVVCLVAFVVQTEMASQLAKQGYDKAIFLLYLTHSSWVLITPLQIVSLWLVKRQPFHRFFRKHSAHLRHTGELIVRENQSKLSLNAYFLKTAAILAVSLNIAGASWYLAVNWTSPSDLTAIYNCSAFFAYAFSVPLLNEPINPTKIASVGLSILGVVIIAYGGAQESKEFPHRKLGNLLISIGAVLYGLYEVLYKKIACPPQSVSSKKQAAFASVVASLIGSVTLLCLWPALVILHFTGIEKFLVPTADQVKIIAVCVFSNMLFSISFLILLSLTSPVLGSVASMLTTFLVPIADWLFYGVRVGASAIIGGLVVVIAFLLMSWASWLEMQEDGDDQSTISQEI